MKYFKAILHYIGWHLPLIIRSKLVTILYLKKIYFTGDPAQFGEGKLLIEFDT